MTLPWYAAAAARAALPIPTSVCSSFVCRKEREQKKKRKRYGRQCLGFLTFQQMLMHAIAHCGCRDTVRESVLEGSARNIPCRTWDSNPRQYCAWLFSGTLYRLSYRPPWSPGRNGGRIVVSRDSFLCWLLFGFPFHPRSVPLHKSRNNPYDSAKSASGRLHPALLCSFE